MNITHLNTALEGRYRIESELGEGGMATVSLEQDDMMRFCGRKLRTRSRTT